MAFNKNFKSLIGGYFLSHGFVEYRRGWLKGEYFSCPFCGRENKFGVNPSSDFYHCFRCDAKGHLLDLIYILEKIDTFNEASILLKKYADLGYRVYEERAEIKEIKPMILPEGFKLLNQGTSQLARSARTYVKKRGFDVDTVSKRGWGYSTDEGHFGYLIMPYYSNNQIVYYNARNFLNPTGPRYLNPDVGDSSVGKSQLIYNEEALYTYNSIYVCEGVFNATTISPERGIATAGKYLSAYQINKILKSPVERVILCLDSDALDKAIEIALKIVPFKKVKIIQFPEGKDINDLGLRKTLKLVYQNKYLTYNQLIQFRNERG